MKTELRIGNLINLIDRRGPVHLPQPQPFKIISLDAFECEMLRPEQNPGLEKEWYSHPYSDIIGIPLTKEWLIKFGFEFYTDTIQWNKDALTLDEFDGAINEECFGIKIWHVHQLQNLYFALTDNELTP